jgi:hypothetical protein
MRWGTTDKELVQSWMAFKELLRRGLVLYDIPKMYKPGQRPEEYGWKNKWSGICTNEYFRKRILSAPEDFRLGHDTFGFDVVSPGGGCLNPSDLPRILARHLGIDDIEALFDPTEVAKEVDRLRRQRPITGASGTPCSRCGGSGLEPS